MLFQMLAGDVPFKGSSIPAIMKKHLSDEVPPFSQFDVQIPPTVERAVRHTLEKDTSRRTASVDDLVDEFRLAIGVSSPNLGTSSAVGNTTNRSLPVSNLNILTVPPQAKIFVDNVACGQSQADGWFMVEGLQSGNHHLRVTSEGFQNWESNVMFEGKPRQIVAELKPEIKSEAGAIPRPTFQTISNFTLPPQTTPAPANFSATQGSQTNTQPPPPQQTWQSPAQPNVAVGQQTSPPVIKKSAFSPVILAVIGIFGVLLLAIVGVGGLYAFGLIGRTDGNLNASNRDIVVFPNNTNNQNSTIPVNKNEMVKITGGKFTMGRSDGDLTEQPEHEVEVKDFWMDKTEVATAEYYDFVKESGFMSTPSNWENGKPLARDEKMPVRFVNIEDIKAFAEWRSARDKVTYRLPTEEEWEYAARNGNANNLYPWGDGFKDGCAVVDRIDTAPEPVGSKACGANNWGVLDLIGNVYEWTSSRASLYPGSKGEVKDQFKGSVNVFRGGGAFNKSTGSKAITSTYRGFIDVSKRDQALGFRLVRSQ